MLVLSRQRDETIMIGDEIRSRSWTSAATRSGWGSAPTARIAVPHRRCTRRSGQRTERRPHRGELPQLNQISTGPQLSRAGVGTRRRQAPSEYQDHHQQGDQREEQGRRTTAPHRAVAPPDAWGRSPTRLNPPASPTQSRRIAMARIQTNISSLIAQRNLQRSQGDLQLRLRPLDRPALNRGADDPAGLIVSERLHRDRRHRPGHQELRASQRRHATAEGALAGSLTCSTRSRRLVVEAANSGAISKEEKEANQLQIDSTVESITPIANSTSFAGLKLLDGSLGYLTSGIDGTPSVSRKINAVSFGTRDVVGIDVQVINSRSRRPCTCPPRCSRASSRPADAS